MDFKNNYVKLVFTNNLPTPKGMFGITSPEYQGFIIDDILICASQHREGADRVPLPTLANHDPHID